MLAVWLDFLPVTTPVALPTCAFCGLFDDQLAVTVWKKSAPPPGGLNRAVAVSWIEYPFGTAVGPEIEMLLSVPLRTVSVATGLLVTVVVLLVLNDAVMLVVALEPVMLDAAVAKPVPSMVAVDGVPDAHVT